MKHRFIIAVVLIAGISLVQSRFHLGPWAASSELGETSVPEQIDTAFQSHASGVMVSAEGAVDRMLADDTSGDRHQRFIMKLPSGVTVLVAHNIDVATNAAKQGNCGCLRRCSDAWQVLQALKQIAEESLLVGGGRILFAWQRQ